MSALITDEMVEVALEASYDPPKEPGYTFLNRDSYRSLWSPHMRAALEAVLPQIATKVLRDADEDLARAASRVDSLHHLYGFKCLCGFEGDGRKRTQTEHITYAMLEAYASVRANRIEKS